MDLKETNEVFDFTDGVLDDLIEHKKNDGTVDMLEWTQTALVNAPAAYTALDGSDQIVDELRDVDAAEIAEIAQRGLALARKIAALLQA
jgi:hypothetical protein